MFTSLSFQILVTSLENSDEANIPHFRGVWLTVAIKYKEPLDCFSV